MKQEFLKHFPYTELTTLALLIFFGLFVAVIIRLYLPSGRRAANEAKYLPLEVSDE